MARKKKRSGGGGRGGGWSAQFNSDLLIGVVIFIVIGMVLYGPVDSQLSAINDTRTSGATDSVIDLTPLMYALVIMSAPVILALKVLKTGKRFYSPIYTKNKIKFDNGKSVKTMGQTGQITYLMVGLAITVVIAFALGPTVVDITYETTHNLSASGEPQYSGAQYDILDLVPLMYFLGITIVEVGALYVVINM